MKPTEPTKELLFLSGRWICKVPPVSTAHWNTAAWIKWIDSNGAWIPL